MNSYIEPGDLNSWIDKLQTAAISLVDVVAEIGARNISGFLTGFKPGDTTVWNQAPVFLESFPVLAAGGQFQSQYGSSWYVYPQGWKDSSGKGIYDPANLSVIDRPDGQRVLRQQVSNNTSNGEFGGCVACPKWAGVTGYLASYRLSYRQKLEQQDYGHNVVLGWPAVNADWPAKSGEPDHTEYNTVSNPAHTGWLHVKGATSGNDHQVHLKSTVPAYDDFHVITVENIAGKSYRRYIDGILNDVVLTAGQTPTFADTTVTNLVTLDAGYSVPDEALRTCFQLESNGIAPLVSTIVDTNWVVIQTII